MRALNLIPDYQKAQMRKEKIFLLFHNVIGVLVVAVALISIFLVISRSILTSYVSNLRNETTLVNLSSLGLQKEIKTLNNKIERAALAQKNFRKWSALFADLGGSAPPGVVWQQIYLNRASGAFRIAGTAATREALLQFKEILLNHPAVQELETPLSNFLEKENLSFVFGGKIKQDAYTAP